MIPRPGSVAFHYHSGEIMTSFLVVTKSALPTRRVSPMVPPPALHPRGVGSGVSYCPRRGPSMTSAKRPHRDPGEGEVFAGGRAHVEASGAAEGVDHSRAGTGNSHRSEIVLVVSFSLIALSLAAVFSGYLASRDSFLGAFGDTENLIWQARNVSDVGLTGDSILRSSFLGTPTPLSYTPTSYLEAFPILFVYRVTRNVFFAYNFVMLFFLYLNFLSMYVVLRLLRSRVVTAIVGASVFSLAPTTLVRVGGHMWFVITFTIPLYLYFMYRIKRDPTRLRLWVALGMLNGLLLWTHEYYGMFGVLMFGIFALVNLRTLWHGRAMIHLIAWTVSFSVLAFPVVELYRDQHAFDRANHITTKRTPEEGALFSSTPVHYLFAGGVGWVHKKLPHVVEISGSLEGFNYLGIFNLLALLLFLVSRRVRAGAEGPDPPVHFVRTMRWELILIAGVAVILSLGPVLPVNQTVIRLPADLAYRLNVPVLSQLRAWGRFGTFAFAVATMVSVHVFGFLASRYLRRPVIAAGALLLLVPAIGIDQYPFDTLPPPRHRAPIPPIVEKIGHEPGRFYVLQLPFTSAGGGLLQATAQVFQFVNRKPIANGSTSFQNPLYVRLIQSSTLGCFDYPAIRRTRTPGPCSSAALATYLHESGVRYVYYEKVTHFFLPGEYEPKEDAEHRALTLEVITSLLEKGAVRQVYSDQDYDFYRVN